MEQDIMHKFVFPAYYAKIATLGHRIGHGRLQQLAEQLEAVSKGEAVQFYDASLPKGIVQVHRTLTEEQVPQVQALCDEAGYEMVRTIARHMYEAALYMPGM